MEKINNIVFFLRKFLNKKRSGRLIVDKDRIRREHYFLNSRLVYSISNSPSEKFGVFLKLFGVHLQDDIEKIMQGQYKARIGKRLVELGFIDERLLREILLHQTKEIFISTIKTFDVKYKWEERKETPNQAFSAELPILPLIFEGLRRIEDYESVRVALRGELEATIDYNSQLLKHLSEIELKIFNEIKAGNVPEPSDFGLEKNKFNRILFTLLALGFIKVRKEEDEIAELETIYNRLDSVNYWELLGVPAGASVDMVKNAYYALSKKFHPDKFSSYGGKEKEMASRVFEQLTRAYDVLTNPEKRQEYTDKFKPVSFQAKEIREERITPEERFKEGRVMYNRKKIKEATYLFDLAVRMEPQNYKYVYWLGLALSKLPGEEKKAEETLLKAAELSPWDAQPYVVLATMFAKRGLVSKALKFLDKALSIDPTHPSALKLKSTLEEKTKKKGLFGFFKK